MTDRCTAKSGPRFRVLDDVLPLDVAQSLRIRLEREGNWNLHEEAFFSQWDRVWVRREFGSPAIGKLDEGLEILYGTGRSLIESEFDFVVGSHYSLVVHRMVPEQAIGIHNDSADGARGTMENCRFLYYVDADFHDHKGGHLVLFNSRNADDIAAVVRPHFNSAVLLHLSDASLHAVLKVKQGVRYSIVASYWTYPILGATIELREIARRCMKALVALNLETIGHSGTTFAYHLYNTYRILVRWDAPPSVILAGLLHSVLGRPSFTGSAVMSESQLIELAGPDVLAIVRALRRDNNGSLQQVPPWQLNMIEAANSLEQAESLADLNIVNRYLNALTADAPAYRARVEDDIAEATARLQKPSARQAQMGRTIHSDR